MSVGSIIEYFKKQWSVNHPPSLGPYVPCPPSTTSTGVKPSPSPQRPPSAVPSVGRRADQHSFGSSPSRIRDTEKEKDKEREELEKEKQRERGGWFERDGPSRPMSAESKSGMRFEPRAVSRRDLRNTMGGRARTGAGAGAVTGVSREGWVGTGTARERTAGAEFSCSFNASFSTSNDFRHGSPTRVNLQAPETVHTVSFLSIINHEKANSFLLCTIHLFCIPFRILFISILFLIVVSSLL